MVAAEAPANIDTFARRLLGRGLSWRGAGGGQGHSDPRSLIASTGSERRLQIVTKLFSRCNRRNFLGSNPNLKAVEDSLRHRPRVPSQALGQVRGGEEKKNMDAGSLSYHHGSCAKTSRSLPGWGWSTPVAPSVIMQHRQIAWGNPSPGPSDADPMSVTYRFTIETEVELQHTPGPRDSVETRL